MLLDGSCWQYMLPKSPRNKQPPSASSDTYRHLLSSFRSYAGPAIPQHSVTLEMLLRHEVPTLMSAPDHLELALNARLHSLSRTRGTATSGIHFGVPLKKPPKNAGSRASHLPACCWVFWSWNRWGTWAAVKGKMSVFRSSLGYSIYLYVPAPTSSCSRLSARKCRH